MNNYKMTIQYDGSRYKGWQRLGNDENTIQGKIEKVLSTIEGEEVEIIGCSRTDAGVHALAQVANVKLKSNVTPSDLMSQLNKSLPQDISIFQVELVPERFHARYNAGDKTYLYKIWNEEYSHPFMRKLSLHVEKKLNVKVMKQASQHFVGEHDFTAYSNAKSKKKSMVREITAVTVEENDGVIEVRVRGNGFLHNMVRKIVGTLIEIGLGKKQPDDVPLIIASKERQVALMADARGLYLERIEY
ncbi:tRNA pseudouridine(38-40) synthase TruA [Bacillus sp. BGMRC 2118]|nr:tRNA pseudouridine(38-40) synthase TruA [Bacillus sp. BGMRC 2118]